MWWIVAAVVLGGTAIAMQAPVNAALARELGGPVPAAAVSFGVGFLVLLLITLLQGQGAAFLKLPQVPAWTLVAALTLGQMSAAMVIDATGALGVAVREVTLTRLAAAGLVMAGLILSRV